MAQDSWKRYYSIIVVDWAGKTRLYPYDSGKVVFYKKHSDAIAVVANLKKFAKLVRPIGIASIRGNKRNPELQKYLLDNSK